MRSGGGPAGLPRAFRLLWLATGVSNLGDGLRLTALPLLATSVTTSPVLIAGVTVAQRVAWLCAALPGGAWADRYDRRLLRAWLDVARALVVGALMLLIAQDVLTVPVLYVITAVLSAAEAVVDNSSVALVPATVDQADLERAGSRLMSTELVAGGLVGPPLGGLLFGLEMAAPFGVDAITFAVAAGIMLLNRGASPTPGGRKPAPSESTARQILTGFGWFWRRPTLRNLALLSTGMGTASFLSAAVFVIFAQRSLGLSITGYGVLMVAGAIGGVLGSVLAPRLAGLPLRHVLTAATAATGVATLLTSFTSVAWVAGLLAGISTAGVLVWNVLTLALRQRMIPDHLLGRVGASYRFMVQLGMPIGALAGGLLTDAFGVRSALFGSGCCLLAIALTIPALLSGAEPPRETAGADAPL
jgi:MFS family permease